MKSESVETDGASDAGVNGQHAGIRSQQSLLLLDVILLILVGLVLYIVAALFSYTPGDPGWLRPGEGAGIKNWAGLYGAILADMLFKYWGHIAYVLPVLMGVVSIRLFQHIRRRVMIRWEMIALRGSGMLLVMLGCAGITSQYLDAAHSSPGYVGFGGRVGEMFWKELDILGPGGALLVCVFTLMLGVSLSGWVSWLRLLEFVQSTFSRLLARIFSNRSPPSESGMLAPELARDVSSGKEDPLQGEGKDTQVERLKTPPSGRGRRGRAKEKGKEDEVALGGNGDEGRKPPRASKAAGKEAPSKKKSVRPAANPSLKAASKEDAGDNGSGAESVEAEPVEAEEEAPSYEPPALTLLHEMTAEERRKAPEEILVKTARLLETRFKEFGLGVEVESVEPGPVITRFEIQPASGIKVSKISALSRDLARSLAVSSVRVVEVIPGKTTVGIEIPNEHREIVRLKEILAAPAYQGASSPVTMALGKDVSGNPVVSDLARMPHLLVAGTTGSGKSVGINVMLLSILFKSSPEDVRLVLVDPKMLELSVYDGIPHLLTPVITDMQEAANALRWCVGEMERRYQLMSARGVRNISGYNARVDKAIADGESLSGPGWGGDDRENAPFPARLPLIVVVIDEFADMMMTVGKSVEELIARIAQKARAAGIHLILATQRPSVNVITGLIKANVPSRISFLVSSRIDSRTVLDQGGAESLLGHGDMLYLPVGASEPQRVHGAYADDQEVHMVTDSLRAAGEPEYIEEILQGRPASEQGAGGGKSASGEERDELYDEAVACVLDAQRATISFVQRRLRIGYNRSARLIEAMEEDGLISAPDQSGNREVLRSSSEGVAD